MHRLPGGEQVGDLALRVNVASFCALLTGGQRMARLRYLAGSAVIVAGIGFLTVSGLRQSTAAHTTLAALLEGDPAASSGRRLQLGGSHVEPGSIVWGPYRSRPAFVVTDGERSLRAEYVGKGMLPDTFRDGAQLVLEGRYDPGVRVFYADAVYAKCPARYEGGDYGQHRRAHGKAPGDA